jgi:hypothetical protein
MKVCWVVMVSMGSIGLYLLLMNFVDQWWKAWKNRHRHVYVTRRCCVGERWGAPVYLVEKRCNCCKAAYRLVTCSGVEKVESDWAKGYFEE